jgi:hypothetical protein
VHEKKATKKMKKYFASHVPLLSWRGAGMSFFLAVVFALAACNKDLQYGHEDKGPRNYEEMFKAVNLVPGVTYTYAEMVNNSPSGKKGTIRFLLNDLSMTETYNSYTTRDHFALDSFQLYGCRFLNKGLGKHDSNKTVFINNAQTKLSRVNNVTMVSFDKLENGSYYYYQYIISP